MKRSREIVNDVNVFRVIILRLWPLLYMTPFCHTSKLLHSDLPAEAERLDTMMICGPNFLCVSFIEATPKQEWHVLD